MQDQHLVARIKRSSKYWGQTRPNQWFDVSLRPGDSYCVRGNNNQYQLRDVSFGVRLADGSIKDLGKAAAR